MTAFQNLPIVLAHGIARFDVVLESLRNRLQFPQTERRIKREDGLPEMWTGICAKAWERADLPAGPRSANVSFALTRIVVNSHGPIHSGLPSRVESALHIPVSH